MFEKKRWQFSSALMIFMDTHSSMRTAVIFCSKSDWLQKRYWLIGYTLKLVHKSIIDWLEVITFAPTN